TIMVYSALFAIGKFLYGESTTSFILFGITTVCGIILWLIWRKKS
ncbi:MAG: LPXTG-motif cell wall-anchored protein, partial [Flavobacteriales bacterium]